jgi:hypothetical protein
VGALLATLTGTFHIAWAPDNNTHPFVPVTFDLSAQNITLPNEIIYGLAFNTQTYGTSPTGYIGPYNSLNFAVGGNNGGSNPFPPTVGTDFNPDAVFWNTETASWYADNGAGGTGTFRQDTNWAPYIPMVEFNANEQVPEPASLALWGLVSAAGAAYGYRRRRLAKPASEA